ncbi:MAG: hypothetical protein L0L18_14070 [Acidipropionibacterium jensenii]|nr:hypothetical protein [Actinomyces sp.]MDN6428640.1 hypothetical protein [Propionibacterium sp.]MDN6660101.1 hypothetical protein [Acidipropionibacterium jensenii]MDN6794530.1 hypothetical protein [Propionibacterium sp.]
MKAEDFAEGTCGSPVREPGNRHAFTHYLPRPIPRDLTISTTAVELMSEADAALGTLQGLGVIMTDPEMLIGPYLRREAIASSRIEGTQASLTDVLQAELEEPSAPSGDIRGVQRYLEATRLAYELT